MHTEVDVPNPGGSHPGSLCGSHLTLEARNNVLSVPLEAVNHEGEQTTVYVVSQTDQFEGRSYSWDCRPRMRRRLCRVSRKANQWW